MRFFRAVCSILADKDIAPGDIFPEGRLPASVVTSFLKKGSIVELEDGTSAPPVEVPPPRDGNWAFDPADLAGLELEILNMLISEHAEKLGTKVEPFEDAEKARAFMSAEFR